MVYIYIYIAFLSLFSLVLFSIQILRQVMQRRGPALLGIVGIRRPVLVHAVFHLPHVLVYGLGRIVGGVQGVDEFFE